MAVQDDSASCMSLPAVLCSNEPTYSVIPDNVAAAQRPLPAILHTYSEIPDAVAAAQRPLPALPHTYSEIPDAAAVGHLDQPAIPHAYCVIPDDDGDDKGSNSFNAAAADQSSGIGYCPYGDTDENNQPKLASTLRNHHQAVAVRQTAAYGSDIEARDHHSSVYGAAANATSQQTRQAQGLGRARNTPRRASLPLLLPNTYWPLEIPGEVTSNTTRRTSLPLVTLPVNTYWPWEIPGKGTQNTP
ncbi:hypothetical protein Bbelb_126350 [Branchiostoma belcheri]|nr:hypothetical protein Bbelb_126350 [Branchiostoma belcheri]